VQEIWRRMQDNGDIYIDSYAGWYSVRDEAYYAEDETKVGEDNVRRGPQGTPVEWVEEKSYFFKLSAYQDKLLHLYESQPDFIGPDSRRNEVMSFVRGGLKDLSISRTTFDWGVKVPNDPEHVMYVWVDALTNYITGVGYPDQSDKHWRYWPADVHIIGKDIIRFHAVYWPAFLMSAGIPLQKRVYAHGFLFNRGEKMSKSVGNVVDPFNLADQYGVDQVRYFFLREVPFGQDGNYNHEAIVARINADLANDFGNLAQRSLSMINKNCDAKVPALGELTDADNAIIAEVTEALEAAQKAMDEQLVHEATGALIAALSSPQRRARSAAGAADAAENEGVAMARLQPRRGMPLPPSHSSPQPQPQPQAQPPLRSPQGQCASDCKPPDRDTKTKKDSKHRLHNQFLSLPPTHPPTHSPTHPTNHKYAHTHTYT
jgi:methionyl-tRNA synthetase